MRSEVDMTQEGKQWKLHMARVDPLQENSLRIWNAVFGCAK